MIDELEGKILAIYVEDGFKLLCDADKGLILI